MCSDWLRNIFPVLPGDTLDDMGEKGSRSTGIDIFVEPREKCKCQEVYSVFQDLIPNSCIITFETVSKAKDVIVWYHLVVRKYADTVSDTFFTSHCYSYFASLLLVIVYFVLGYLLEELAVAYQVRLHCQLFCKRVDITRSPIAAFPSAQRCLLSFQVGKFF